MEISKCANCGGCAKLTIEQHDDVLTIQQRIFLLRENPGMRDVPTYGSVRTAFVRCQKCKNGVKARSINSDKCDLIAVDLWNTEQAQAKEKRLGIYK